MNKVIRRLIIICFIGSFIGSDLLIFIWQASTHDLSYLMVQGKHHFRSKHFFTAFASLQVYAVVKESNSRMELTKCVCLLQEGNSVQCQRTECPNSGTVCEQGFRSIVEVGTENDCCPKYKCCKYFCC